MAAWQATGRPVRSTANGQKYDRWATAVDRPGRPKQNREQSSLLRSTGPVDPENQRADILLRSTGPVDRPSDSKRAQTCARPVDRPGRPFESWTWKTGLENLGKIFYKKSFNTSKNHQKCFYHFILKHKPVIKISRQYINISIHFCVLPILSKTKLVFLSNLIFPNHE